MQIQRIQYLCESNFPVCTIISDKLLKANFPVSTIISDKLLKRSTNQCFDVNCWAIGSSAILRSLAVTFPSYARKKIALLNKY